MKFGFRNVVVKSDYVYLDNVYKVVVTLIIYTYYGTVEVIFLQK